VGLKLSAFLAELKRRKVGRVAVMYVVVGLGVLGAAEVILDPLGLQAARPFVVIFALLGFPIALVLGWAYDLTPEGVVKTVPSDEPSEDVGELEPSPPLDLKVSEIRRGLLEEKGEDELWKRFYEARALASQHPENPELQMLVRQIQMATESGMRLSRTGRVVGTGSPDMAGLEVRQSPSMRRILGGGAVIVLFAVGVGVLRPNLRSAGPPAGSDPSVEPPPDPGSIPAIPVTDRCLEAFQGIGPIHQVDSITTELDTTLTACESFEGWEAASRGIPLFPTGETGRLFLRNRCVSERMETPVCRDFLSRFPREGG
jgi:hypothetical protein